MSEELFSFERVRDAIDRTSHSPLAVKIIEVAANDKAPVQSLAAVIAADPLLAARLLRVVNFATGLSQRLTLLPQAINALGFDIIKALALGLSTFSLPAAVGADEIGEGPITLRHLFEHSLGCAAVAGRIAARLDYTMSHHVFAAGFLHDIGEVLLYRHAKQAFLKAAQVAVDKNIPMSEAETLAIGMNHLEIGEAWASRGILPAGLRQTMRHHHERLCLLPDSMGRIPRQALSIVQLADSLCGAVQPGIGGDSAAARAELWATIGLREQECLDEIAAAKQEVEAARQLFGFPTIALKQRFQMSRPASKRNQDAPAEYDKIAMNAGGGRVIRFPSPTRIKEERRDRSSSKKLKILVVEDHGSLCDMLSLYFMRHGYHVRTANNGETALEVLANEQINIVLLDLMLPRLDGFGVLQQVRMWQDHDPPYIIVVSAGASERDRSKVLELGANEYMPKPFHLMRLLERIQSVEKYLS